MDGDDHLPTKKVRELAVRVNDLEATLREALCTLQNNQETLQNDQKTLRAIIEQYVTCMNLSVFCQTFTDAEGPAIVFRCLYILNTPGTFASSKI